MLDSNQLLNQSQSTTFSNEAYKSRQVCCILYSLYTVLNRTLSLSDSYCIIKEPMHISTSSCEFLRRISYQLPHDTNIPYQLGHLWTIFLTLSSLSFLLFCFHILFCLLSSSLLGHRYMYI